MRTMTYDSIAKLCHAVNKAYCEALGDTSQVSWDSTQDWQKNSTASGVEFHMTSKGHSPEHGHNNWYREKERDGWKYGEEKNVELKTHPCMKPYSELPVEQRAKDHIFKAICDFFKEEYVN